MDNYDRAAAELDSDREEQIKKNQKAMRFLEKTMEEDKKRFESMTPEEIKKFIKEADEDTRELMQIIDDHRHRKLFS